jgi:hypothetical protein
MVMQSMPQPHEHYPGEPAPRSGRHEELNVFGSPSGKVIHVEEGEELPAAPRGITWRHVSAEGC